MLDLCAITGHAADLPFRGNHRTYYKDFRRRNIYMRIQGDEPVQAFFFDDSNCTLICRADLLESDLTDVAAHLARLYREQGDRFVVGLRGTFAIILYDHNQGMLKAWSDHFGAERLVFRKWDQSLAVSTSIQIVLSTHVEQPAISAEAILEYLLYSCIPTPKTIYEGISKLPPAHQLVSDSGIRTQSYWDIGYEERDDLASRESVWANRTHDAIRSAVALSLKNVPHAHTRGCFLSGGTDSSSVAGLSGQLTGAPPRTFSIGFDDARYNEIQYARAAAKRFSADHHEYFVTPADIPSVAQKAAQVYEEPFGNSSIVPTFYCARLAAEHNITHLLAGDGGDELFAGNSRYVDDRVFQRYRAIPQGFRRFVIEPAVAGAARFTNFSLANLAASYIRRSNIPAPDRYFSYGWTFGAATSEVFTSDFLAAVHGHDPLSTARSHFTSAPAQCELNRWLYLDLKITIADNDLAKVMTMSRLAGVTPRFPFLNPTLAEFSGKLPAHLKIKGPRLRYIFKQAMAELLPHEVLTKKKHGFGLPYSVWLADWKTLRDFTFDVLGSVHCRQRGYFRPGLLERLWSQYENVHRGYYGEILWTLLMLELWHVNHVDSAGELRPVSRNTYVLPGSRDFHPPATTLQFN